MKDSDEDSIFVISKEQALEVINNTTYQTKIENVTYSSIIFTFLLVVFLFFTVSILLILLSPLFFIEYFTNTLIRKKESKNENYDTIN
jgi:hypothetical protein